jgi:hypothetical protein
VSGNPTIQTDRNVNAGKGKQGSEDGAAQRDNSPTYNWGIWVFTLVVAICAAIQAGALIYQYRAMRDQVSRLRETVEATEKLWKAAQKQGKDLEVSIAAAVRSADAAEKAAKTLQDSDRPYIFVEVTGDIQKEIRPAETAYIDARGAVRIREKGQIAASAFWACRGECSLKNDGKTPAILTNIIAKLWWGNLTDTPPSIDEPIDDSIPRGGTVIDAGQTKPFPVGREMDESEARNIEGANRRLFCYGWIGYEDIFRVRHFTKFCWEFQNRVSERGFFLSPSKELNDYT